ncbi:MAG: DUF3817 domain-containing protein [Gordonia sp. (in: high G+C Gram-positive bacteria)]|uniref:DUF3817 domain-containing protein n=1 Tax=Gordonia sp. (in: high G+C Gram-positive bacteria) TaxID=84139 RepID=UPI003BB48D08
MTTTSASPTWTDRWFNLSEPAPRFRLIALIEAMTWLLLIIGMILKRTADIESATMVPGMLHGIAFMVYLGVTIWTASELGWGRKVTVLALLASIPPFFTLIFEWWAERKGHLFSLAEGAAVLAEDVDSGNRETITQ